MEKVEWTRKEEEKIYACEMVCPICGESCLVWTGCTYTYCPNCGCQISEKTKKHKLRKFTYEV